MNNLDFTLLDINDAYQYGKNALITDFAILLGGYVSTKKGIINMRNLKDRTGFYFTKTRHYLSRDKYGYFDVPIPTCIVPNNGFEGNSYYGFCLGDGRHCCARPAISYSSIINQFIAERSNNLSFYKDEFGEYPQTIVNSELASKLEKIYKKSELQKTGKEYTTDSCDCGEWDIPFKERKHIEYEYNGEKYIRILGDYISKGKQLSNGRIVKEGNPYWIKVEPIVWKIYKYQDDVVSEKLLFAGIKFCDNERTYNGDFENTRIKWFLDNYFSKDIVPSKIENKKEEKPEENKVISAEDDNTEEKIPYLVKYENSDEIYGAFELDGILRDIITSLELVNRSSRKSINVLKYSSKQKTTFKILESSYIKDMNKLEYLKYAREISILGKNDKLYKMYTEQIKEEEAKEEVTEYVRNLKNNLINI